MEPPSSLLPPPLQAGLHAALATATSHLRVAMTADGHWRGELSSSALSTAMFSLLWEGDYSPQDAPGEDAIYATLVHALDRMAGAA